MRSATRVVLLCLLVAAGGCDSDEDGGDPAERESDRTVTTPKGIAGTTEVEESGKPAAQAVERNLGREVAAGQPRVIGARCVDGRCVVRYRSTPRGRGVVLREQSRILRRLFRHDDVRSVLLYVHHQSTGTADKNEAPAFATTRCTRKMHPGFAWARIRARDIPRVCRVTHVAGGKQRSLVRRGQLSSEEASRGKGKPGRGREKEEGGPPAKSGGPPGKGGGPPDKE